MGPAIPRTNGALLSVTPRLQFLFGILFLAATQQLAAQGGPVRGEIRGRVVAAQSQAPVGLATIAATGADRSTPVVRAKAGSDGTFRITGLGSGRFRVRIVAIGYAAKDVQVTLDASTPGVDLGTVELTPVAVELQAVEVRSQRQDIQLAPDRSTYVVRDMPTTRGGTALDVLRNVPSVDVDIDNIISLRGNSGVIVQINGRPSPMKPAQLGNFLAQLPAGIVDRIEVVPNPSAREDPTGTAGIINIVLKQDADAGTSGGFTIAGGTTGQINLGANLGYQHGPLTLYGSYGFLRDRRPRSDTIFRQNLYADPITYLDEIGTRLQLPLAHTMTGSVNYDLSDHDELALDGLFSTRDQKDTYALTYRNLDASRTLTGLSDRTTNGKGNESSLEGTLGYRHSFAAKGHKVSSELTLTRDQEGGPGNIVGRTLSLDGTPLGTSALENQTAWERPREGSLKVDYTRPLGKNWRLEAGYKGSLLRIHTTLDTQVFDSAQASYQPDSSRIRDFTWRQVVNAGYAILDAQLGEFTMQGGVRVERATTRFHLNTIGATYANPYNSVFPSGLIAWNVDDSHQIKLSYSTRIRRPDDTDVLDPTPHYQDPLNLSVGNPDLKPEYIRAFELGLQRTHQRLTMQLSPFYRHTLDAVRSIRSIDSAGVTTRTFANIATTDAFGADATVALSGQGRLSGFVGASAFRQVSDASNVGPGLNARTFGWTARANVSYRFSGTFDMQAIVVYRGATTVEQGRNASQTRISLAVRQKLVNDRLSLTLRITDPFNTWFERNTTIDPLFTQVTERRRKIRGLLLNINWMFGKPTKEPALLDPAIP